MSETSERLTKGEENDYHPVNQYIDEQSRLRRARSFWIRAKSWALILIAVGILVLFLAWAYSIIKKHFILSRISNIQQTVIEDETKKVLNSEQFSKTQKAMNNLRKGVANEAERQELQNKLAQEKKDKKNR